jgi:hypothetical protein
MIHLTQLHLIDKIIKDLWLDHHESVATKQTQVAVIQLL